LLLAADDCQRAAGGQAVRPGCSARRSGVG